MGKWLLGQGSLMLILGVASTIVYLSLHVRYAYALGVLTGLLNIIPVLGAALCIALALLVAAIDSWGRVLGIAIFYVIYLWVENSYLIPRIMKTESVCPALPSSLPWCSAPRWEAFSEPWSRFPRRCWWPCFLTNISSTRTLFDLFRFRQCAQCSINESSGSAA
jgi:hypothetical protein